MNSSYKAHFNHVLALPSFLFKVFSVFYSLISTRKNFPALSLANEQNRKNNVGGHIFVKVNSSWNDMILKAATIDRHQLADNPRKHVRAGKRCRGMLPVSKCEMSMDEQNASLWQSSTVSLRHVFSSWIARAIRILHPLRVNLNLKTHVVTFFFCQSLHVSQTVFRLIQNVTCCCCLRCRSNAQAFVSVYKFTRCTMHSSLPPSLRASLCRCAESRWQMGSH